MKRIRKESRCPAGLMSDMIRQQQHDSIHQQQRDNTSQLSQSHLGTHNHMIRSQPNSRRVYPSQPHDRIEVNNPGSSQDKRKGRGPTRCIEITKRSPGQRLDVSFNAYNQAFGPNARKLSSYLGLIARDGQLTPLNYTDWRAMPIEKKDRMMQLTLAAFNLNVDPNIAKSWVLENLDKKWRDYKNRLKRSHYKKYSTDEERLVNCPTNVDPAQWEELVTFWNSIVGKERSEKNSNNRKKLKTSHTAGTKSFATIREEEKAKRSDGQEPNRLEMYILTHTKKNGQYVDGESSNIIERLLDRANQQPENAEDAPAKNDILSQVMGEDGNGHVRTFGMGVKPRDLWGPPSTRVDTMKMVETERVARLAKEEELREMKDVVKNLETNVANLISAFETLRKQVPNDQQLELDSHSNDV